jgi:hypothetical protein
VTGVQRVDDAQDKIKWKWFHDFICEKLAHKLLLAKKSCNLPSPKNSCPFFFENFGGRGAPPTILIESGDQGPLRVTGGAFLCVHEVRSSSRAKQSAALTRRHSHARATAKYRVSVQESDI